MRGWLAIVIATGCGFDKSVASHGPDDAAVHDGSDTTDIDAPADARPIDAPPDAVAIVPFCDPSNPALVACYPFESAVTDGSSHGHDPTTASNTSFAAGEVGNALTLGAMTEIDVPDSSAFDVAAITIEAWVNPTLASFIGGRGGILDCDSQYGFFIQASGALTCTAGGSLTTTALIPSGQWTHVACTSNGTSTVTIYINGAFAQSATAGAMATSSTTGITLGGNNPAGGGNPMVGMLDQLRLWNTARTAAQICADAGHVTCP
jgi:hypothetical protein